MNLLYILLQDRYTFPVCLRDMMTTGKKLHIRYLDADSIRKCISDLKTGRMEKTAGKGGRRKLNYGQKVKTAVPRNMEEYCDFLDLSIEEYMEIQKRVLKNNKSSVWSASGLGQMFLKGRPPQTIEDFWENRSPLPLMGIMRISCWQRRRTCLPGNRLSGFRLAWEGGKHPVKVAPYTRSMLDVFSAESDGDNYIIFQQ